MDLEARFKSRIFRFLGVSQQNMVKQGEPDSPSFSTPNLSHNTEALPSHSTVCSHLFHLPQNSHLLVILKPRVTHTGVAICRASGEERPTQACPGNGLEAAWTWDSGVLGSWGMD